MFSHFKERRYKNGAQTFDASNDRPYLAGNLSLYFPLHDFCLYQFFTYFRHFHIINEI
jgi:hypothetical protein